MRQRPNHGKALQRDCLWDVLLAEEERIQRDPLGTGFSRVSTTDREKQGSGSSCHVQHRRGNGRRGWTSCVTRESIACAKIPDCRGHDLHDPWKDCSIAPDSYRTLGNPGCRRLSVIFQDIGSFNGSPSQHLHWLRSNQSSRAENFDQLDTSETRTNPASLHDNMGFVRGPRLCRHYKLVSQRCSNLSQRQWERLERRQTVGRQGILDRRTLHDALNLRSYIRSQFSFTATRHPAGLCQWFTEHLKPSQMGSTKSHSGFTLLLNTLMKA